MIKNSLSKAFQDLTSDQREAYKAFSSWLEDDYSDHPFILSGYAGSGKTFLSIRFLRKIEEQGWCWTVVAPTHKAVGVLPAIQLVINGAIESNSIKVPDGKNKESKLTQNVFNYFKDTPNELWFCTWTAKFSTVRFTKFLYRDTF